jgi:hypothetical protein
MRWVISFRDTDSDGLLLFTAYDLKDAYRFIRENTNFEMSTVSTPIPFVGNIDELYRLLLLKRREHKKII